MTGVLLCLVIAVVSAVALIGFLLRWRHQDGGQP